MRACFMLATGTSYCAPRLQGCAHPLHWPERDIKSLRGRDRKRDSEKERERESGKEGERKKEKEIVFNLKRNDGYLGTF